MDALGGCWQGDTGTTVQSGVPPCANQLTGRGRGDAFKTGPPGQTQSWWASDQQNGDFSRTLRQIGLKFGGGTPRAELPHCAAALGAGEWYALAE